MAAKSIIEVEVKSEAFEQFKSLFDEYTNALSGTSEQWKDSNSELSNSVKLSELLASQSKKRNSDLQAESDRQRKANEAANKQGQIDRKRELERKKNEEESEKRWKRIREIAKDTVKLWTTGGMLQGVMNPANLAFSAHDLRKSSMQLGIKSGAMQAANVNYQTVLNDPSSTLAKIRDLQSDVTKQKIFYTLGIKDFQTKTADQLLPEMMKKTQEFAKKTPKGQLAPMAEAYSITDVFDMGEITALNQAKKIELDNMTRKAAQDSKMYGMNDAILKRWQDLMVQWERFEAAIKNTFMTVLEPLAGVFTEISKAAQKLLTAFLKSEMFKNLLDKIKKGLDSLSEWLGSDKAEKNIEAFVHWIDVAAGNIYKFAKGLGIATSAFFGNEKTLTGSQYRQIESTLPEDLAKAVTDYLENPSKQNNVGAQFNLQKAVWDANKSDPKTIEALKKIIPDFKMVKNEPKLGQAFVNELKEVGESWFGKVTQAMSINTGSVTEARQTNAEWDRNGATYGIGVSSVSPKGEQRGNMNGVYAAYQKAGLSPAQAKAITAQVGRENAYNSSTVFGSHFDAANGAQNTGFLSWQGTRSAALKKYLNSKGLLKNGQIIKGQASLDAMAEFSVSEMKSGQYKGMDKFLSNKDIGRDEASELLGKNYVKWAYGQHKLKNGTSFDYEKHLAREYGYYNQIGSNPTIIKRGDKDINGQVIDPYAQKTPAPPHGMTGNIGTLPAGHTTITINNGTGNSIHTAATVASIGR